MSDTPVETPPQPAEAAPDRVSAGRGAPGGDRTPEDTGGQTDDPPEDDARPSTPDGGRSPTDTGGATDDPRAPQSGAESQQADANIAGSTDQPALPEASSAEHRSDANANPDAGGGRAEPESPKSGDAGTGQDGARAFAPDEGGATGDPPPDAPLAREFADGGGAVRQNIDTGGGNGDPPSIDRVDAANQVVASADTRNGDDGGSTDEPPPAEPRAADAVKVEDANEPEVGADVVKEGDRDEPSATDGAVKVEDANEAAAATEAGEAHEAKEAEARKDAEQATEAAQVAQDEVASAADIEPGNPDGDRRTPMERWDDSVDKQHQENLDALRAQSAPIRDPGDTESVTGLEESVEKSETKREPTESDGPDTPMGRWERSENELLDENIAAGGEQIDRLREQGNEEGAAELQEAVNRFQEIRDGNDTVGSDGDSERLEQVNAPFGAAAAGDVNAAPGESDSAPVDQAPAGYLEAWDKIEAEWAPPSTDLSDPVFDQVVEDRDANPVLTETFESILEMPVAERWRAAEVLVREMNDADAGERWTLDTDGRRRIPDAEKQYDSSDPSAPGIRAALEVKYFQNYTWKKVDGVRVQEPRVGVPFSNRLEQQIDKDVQLRKQSEALAQDNPASTSIYMPIWVFAGIGPGEKLKEALSNANILWTVFGAQPAIGAGVADNAGPGETVVSSDEASAETRESSADTHTAQDSQPPVPDTRPSDVPRDELPTLAELSERPEVIEAVDAAWADSNADDYATRHEEGSWIIHNQDNDDVRVVRVPGGERAAIRPGTPPQLADGENIAGFFHTHPNPRIDEIGNSWEPGPSPADVRWHDFQQVPGIIRNADGMIIFGP